MAPIFVASVVAVPEAVANEVPGDTLAISALKGVRVATCGVGAAATCWMDALAPALDAAAVLVASLALGVH